MLGARFGHQVDPVRHRDAGWLVVADHLRAGAIARFSPVMQAVEQAAAKDRLIPNAGHSFLSIWVHCRVESDRTPLTVCITPGRVLRLPLATIASLG